MNDNSSDEISVLTEWWKQLDKWLLLSLFALISSGFLISLTINPSTVTGNSVNTFSIFSTQQIYLITGLLIIPAAASRNITNNPKQMVFVAILIGILSVIIGLFTSLELNTASGPSIIVIALILFVVSLIPLELRGRLQK